MLKSVKSMLGYRLDASDGTAGHVHDFYFDERTGEVKYLLVYLGWHQACRKVLVDPVSLHAPDGVHRTIASEATCEAVQQGLRPCSVTLACEQYRNRKRASYGWAQHWGESGSEEAPPCNPAAGASKGLNTALHLADYTVETGAQPLGYIADIIIDCDKWLLSLCILQLDGIGPRHQCAFPYGQIDAFDYENSRMRVRFEKQALLNCPEYRPLELSDPAYESRLAELLGHTDGWAARATR